TAWPFRIRPAHRHNEKQDLSHRQRLPRCSSTLNLFRANLTRADLSSADFTDANLARATLTDAVLAGVIGLLGNLRPGSGSPTRPEGGAAPPKQDGPGFDGG
ncbi:pentapeptide repeat-containing protein, partial [Streptosporangium sp. NPDC001681]|uniref:pentapeptide repeat-containing protein n=1 Tax=Streptosporangium sp. NPDC001681 TaxID=3154395 RepID=UPI003333F196